MSEKITIKYVTSDNRIIVLSESDSTPDRAIKLSRLEKIKLAMELATFLAIIATLCVYVFLATLQFKANGIYRQQASVAKDTEERELRAYVSFKPDKVDISNSPNHPTAAYFKVTNEGQTPARDVVVLSGLELMRYPLAERLEFKIIPRAEGDAKAFLGPHSYVGGKAILNGILTADQMKDICSKESKNRLYLTGMIEYTDAFNVRRHLRFCGCYGGPEMESVFTSLPNAPHGTMTTETGEGSIFEYDSNNNYEY